MNISKRYAWQSVGNCRENNPLLPQSLRGLVIGKSGCEKTTVIFNLLLQPGWLDYNHLYIFGKSLHQQEYKILRKGFEGGFSKQQTSNVFNSQEMPQSALIAIEKYSGVRNGEIRADFYDDCQNITDPSALYPMQKDLLLLDDCFLGILLEFKQFCHRVWSEDHNFVIIDLTSIPTNGKYRQNFNRFYFPTGTV